jgi:membrane-bound serine protease (ClpP class)
MRIRRAVLVASIWMAALSAGTAAHARDVVAIRVEDAISPVTSRYMVDAVRAAERERAAALVIQLDTPGGLDTSMREAAKAILGARVPVIVWVGPAGARAASAGVFITMAAHVAAMARGTNIGAAHPVSIGGPATMDTTMAAKVVNDAVAYARALAQTRGRNADWFERAVRESVSIDAEGAVREGVCDLLADDIPALMKAVDGRVVLLPAGPETLRTADSAVRERQMSLRERLLAIITNPNIAYLLFLAGILGIFFELSSPGAILPGVIGGISLILALFAFQSLPVNYAGVLLILLAIVMFLAEIKVPSHGVLSIGGVISLLLGSLMLIRGGPAGGISLVVIVPAILLTAAFFIFAVAMALRAQRRRAVTGSEGMVGETARVVESLSPEGKVFLRGEIWRASADRAVPKGDLVRIVSMDGLRLRVTPIEGHGPEREE